MKKLRKQLQEIWGDPLVRCPGHQVWWHAGEQVRPDGTIRNLGKPEPKAPGLFWSKGKKYARPKRDEPKYD